MTPTGHRLRGWSYWEKHWRGQGGVTCEPLVTSRGGFPYNNKVHPNVLYAQTLRPVRR